MEKSVLARLMLKWEVAREHLDDLESAIGHMVVEHGKTVVTGNVRATFSKGRRTFDYKAGAHGAPVALVDKHSKVVVDFRALCTTEEWDGQGTVPFKQFAPSVKVKLEE